MKKSKQSNPYELFCLKVGGSSCNL